jgi:hypothetical protein
MFILYIYVSTLFIKLIEIKLVASQEAKIELHSCLDRASTFNHRKPPLQNFRVTGCQHCTCTTHCCTHVPEIFKQMTTRKHTRACVWQHLAGNLVVFVDERGKKETKNGRRIHSTTSHPGRPIQQSTNIFSVKKLINNTVCFFSKNNVPRANCIIVV